MQNTGISIQFVVSEDDVLWTMGIFSPKDGLDNNVSETVLEV